MNNEKRLKVSEFVEIVGCAARTVYRMIESKKLVTVTDIVKGRKTTFIITNDEEIQKIKNELGILSVNDSQCEESLRQEPKEIIQNPVKSSDILDKMLEITQQYNDKLLSVNDKLLSVTDELLSYKQRIPLLEVKASREGEYIQRIKDLETNNDKLLSVTDKLQKSKNKVIVTLITVILFAVVTACALTVLLVIEHKKPPKIVQTEKVVEKVVEKPVYRYIYKK